MRLKFCSVPVHNLRLQMAKDDLHLASILTLKWTNLGNFLSEVTVSKHRL